MDKPLQESVAEGEERRTMQAPNREGVWSRSQQAREKAMVGPRFEQMIMYDQVRDILNFPKMRLKRMERGEVEKKELAQMQRASKGRIGDHAEDVRARLLIQKIRNSLAHWQPSSSSTNSPSAGSRRSPSSATAAAVPSATLAFSSTSTSPKYAVAPTVVFPT